ncbi:MAG: YceI family protein [Bacteroidota bacterium]|nr:YceI family protein [Bacteroidota bacterium]MDP4215963.1 YceI family protein [Bacteroidota bacterium]MDP4246268.1 YceI family protein [Bacteroidota bacterium]MDP4254416.1 YceI family protein [Bacteroidota bacterium]MDP4257848.1 YceI family protein [Bacteroidota bacterium]
MTIKNLITGSAFISSLLFAGNWKVDAEKSKINFSVKGPFGTVHGHFTGLKADIQFSEKDPSAGSVSASVEAKTVSTGIGLRNSDLRNKAEWLDVAKYPEISYRSKKIEKSGNGYKAIGELTLKGVSKPVDIPFTFTAHEGGGVFKGKFSIKRDDYKVGKPGGSVGEEITIDLEVPVKK